MRIQPEQTACLIIDMQERHFPHMQMQEELKKNTLTLVRGLQVLNVPILLTQQYTRGLGATIPEISHALSELQALEKISFSCCDEPAVMQALLKLGKKVVLLAGIETHVCVLQTALDLKAAGYVPVLVQDCVSSRKASDRDTALVRLRQEGVLFTSLESILFELTRFAGTAVFKEISSLVK